MLKWIIIFVLVVVAGGGYWYYRGHHAEAAQYQTAPVTRGDLTQVVTATGQVEPVLNVQVGSQISGRINKILVDYNSVVKSNQPIAQIDPSTYEAIARRGEADLTNAMANMTLARVQAQRADSLFTNKRSEEHTSELQ